MVALGTDPTDAPLLEEQRGFGSETASGEVEHADPPEQQRRRRRATEGQSERDRLPLAPGERVSPEAVARGIEHRRAIGREGEGSATFDAQPAQIVLFDVRTQGRTQISWLRWKASHVPSGETRPSITPRGTRITGCGRARCLIGRRKTVPVLPGPEEK